MGTVWLQRARGTTTRANSLHINAHSDVPMCATAHCSIFYLFFFFSFFVPAGLVSAPKLDLGLPVFLRVTVKCIHRLLRGPRLEGDCFRSDKNRLAP